MSVLEAANYRFHPSSLYAIMSDPRETDVGQLTAEELAIYRKTKRTPEEQQLLDYARSRSLSEGAKTFLKALARDQLLGVSPVIKTKEMRKGNECEQDSIDLYNAVTFQQLVKNTERRKNNLLNGECDLWIPGERTIDMKTVWSSQSFPLLSEDAHSPVYEWQGRGYMMLWDVPEHEVAFCLVDTPDDLMRGESPEAHKVAHINPKLRVTRIVYKRDMALEKKIEIKVLAAQKYLAQVAAQARNEHGIVADWRARFAQ